MRFVILHHTNWPGREDHYDLMLEYREGEGEDDLALKTFSTLSGAFPDGKSHSDARARGAASNDPNSQTNLLKLSADHRRAYLEFEGTLSLNRGEVRRVEAGALSALVGAETGWQEVRCTLSGTQLKGEFRLRHLGGGMYVFERLKR